MQKWVIAKTGRCRNAEIMRCGDLGIAEYLDSERVTFAMTVREWNKLSMMELDSLGGVRER